MTSPLPAPSGDEVHVWWLSLRADSPEVERAIPGLSADERERAGRFHFERDRNRFVLARACLRSLLGAYTNEAPARVPLRLAPSGKPFLPGRSECQFNLSHCEDRGVVAVASRPVGVDLERIREVPEALAIAGNLFAPSENRALCAVAEPARSEAFLRCWTRKEAYVKARGEGLMTSLVSFEVSLDRGSPKLMSADGGGAGAWTLRELEAGPDWVGAVAVELGSARLVYGDWSPG